MKLKTTLLLTLTFFFLMLAASIASAFVGYLMGREALKVVTQPDIESEGGVRGKQPEGALKGLTLVSEREILTDIYHLTHPQESENEKQQSQSAKWKN